MSPELSIAGHLSQISRPRLTVPEGSRSSKASVAKTAACPWNIECSCWKSSGENHAPCSESSRMSVGSEVCPSVHLN